VNTDLAYFVCSMWSALYWWMW